LKEDQSTVQALGGGFLLDRSEPITTIVIGSLKLKAKRKGLRKRKSKMWSKPARIEVIKQTLLKNVSRGIQKSKLQGERLHYDGKNIRNGAKV